MRVGIIGAGGMGNVHARHYRRMQDVEILFYDIDESRAFEFEQQHKANRSLTLEHLLTEADVADICLPTDLHLESALTAIEAGRPTFIEKPISGKVEDAERIVEKAAERGVSVGVGHVVRFFPEYRTAREHVKAGKIGTPSSARTRRGGAMPAKPWFADHSRSGGVLIDLAIHDFDWLRWTLGEVREVFSQSVGAKTGSGPDYALTTLSFENGAVAHVESTWMDPGGFRTSFEVCGSGGMIEFDSRASSTIRGFAEGKPSTEAPLAKEDDPYYRQLSQFLVAVAGGAEPPVTAADGLAALRIAESALESARTGKPITL